jgi:hypothetical protein
MINFKGQTVSVLIGESKQYDRARLSIWVDGQPTGEFYETIDGQHWASLIRPHRRSALRAGEPLPPLYRGTRVESYREMTGLAGRGIPNGLATIIVRNDLRSAVYHAAARWVPRRYNIYAIRPVRSE